MTQRRRPPSNRAWRFRRCPACGHVAAAGRFMANHRGRSWTTGADIRRTCPNCGHQAPTRAFELVRDQRPADVRGGAA